jgi:hypothetical protein
MMAADCGVAQKKKTRYDGGCVLCGWEARKEKKAFLF